MKKDLWKAGWKAGRLLSEGLPAPIASSRKDKSTVCDQASLRADADRNRDPSRKLCTAHGVQLVWHQACAHLYTG